MAAMEAAPAMPVAVAVCTPSAGTGCMDTANMSPDVPAKAVDAALVAGGLSDRAAAGLEDDGGLEEEARGFDVAFVAGESSLACERGGLMSRPRGMVMGADGSREGGGGCDTDESPQNV